MTSRTLISPEAISLAPVGFEVPAPTEHETSPNDRVEQVRKAAYTRYEERGSQSGHEDEDWLLAEAEIDARGRGNESRQDS